jgi:hypothetical protein
MEQLTKLRTKAKKEADKITVITNMREVIGVLLKIMKVHIGEENRISRRNLFKAVYKIVPEDCSELQEWILWEGVKRGLHRMRQRTKCFVVSKQYPLSKYSSKRQGVWFFWVCNSMSDYIIYRDNLNRNIRAMHNMMKKCERSIKNKWYQNEWEYK